jgi:MFS family permease
MSLYIKDTGAADYQVGIVMGSFAIGLLLFRPWLGRLADYRGRKFVLLIGIAVAAIAPPAYLLTHSIPLLMAIRVFHGISIAAFTTAFSALVVDISPPQHRGELIGYLTLTNPLGVALGPALGGFLQNWAGYPPLFLMAGGMGLLGWVCALQTKVNSIQPNRPDDASPKVQSPFWQRLTNPALRIPALVLLLVGLAFGTLSTFVPLYIQETKVPLNAGLFYTAAAIASFSARLITGPASDQWGRGRFISLSLVLYTVSMLLLWQATTAVDFLVAGFLEGGGAGMLIPMMIALMADRSHPDERGQVFALCIAGFDLGIALAGPSLGFLASTLGYRGLFGLAACLTLLALVCFVTQASKDLPHSIQFALSGGRDGYALGLSDRPVH